MNDIKMVPFKVQHLDLMDIREHELMGVFNLKDIRKRLTALEKVSTAGTMLCDGRVLGVMGFLDMWPGVCEVWVLPSSHVKEYSRIFAQTVKKNLKNLEDVFDYHRIQVTALYDVVHNRWLNWLGFKYEGMLVEYTTEKQNFAMWARIKHGT